MSAPDPSPTQGGSPQPGGTAPQPPGYPAYPQGGYGYPAYPAYPQWTTTPNPNYAQGTNNPYGYPPGYGPPYPGYYVVPPRPKGDTYRLVVGIISLIALSILVLIGLLAALVIVIGSVSSSGAVRDNLSAWTLFLLVGTLALGGGGVGFYFSIRALLGRPSAQLRLPSFILPLALTIVVFATAIANFDLGQPQGSVVMQTPLLLLTGILPALTIYTLAAQRLGFPTTWRRAWMSFLSGVFLATTVAAILETVAQGVIAQVLSADGPSLNGQVNYNDIPSLLATLLIYSVVAPLAEEGFKPVGALVILGRLRSPAEAFIVGMSAGIGFAILETTLYISSVQADWVVVAFDRIGAGLVHGIGAGMATMGWYYIFRGRGVDRRYAKGFGALLYAVVQHGTWNAFSVFITAIPGPVGDFLNSPAWLFGLPASVADYTVILLYAVLIGVLLTVTGRLRPQQPTTNAGTAVPATEIAVSNALGGGR